MQSLKLTASELDCLRFIANHGRVQLSEISEELKVLPPQVSRITARLGEKDFIRTEKVGLSKIVSLSETKHAALFRKLTIELAHMPLDELLSGPSLEVLSAICFLQLKSRKEIAVNALVSEPSVAKALGKMKQVGIVQKIGLTYSVSPRFQMLREFVIEFRHYLNQKIALKFASDAVVLWECNAEFIIESARSQEGDGFQLTHVSMFGSFGIPLMVPKSYFFYSPFVKRLIFEDIIIHSLLVGDRNMLPILLVWKRNERTIDRKYLEKQAERYYVKDNAKEIITYFANEGRERAPGFPPWNEFLLRAKEYGLL